MTKTIKKLVSVVLALSLCMSLFSVHIAAEASDVPMSSDYIPDGAPQGTVVENAGDPVAQPDTPVAGQTTTTQTSTTTWTDSQPIPDGGSDANYTGTVETTGQQTVTSTVVTQNGEHVADSIVTEGKETTTVTGTKTESKTEEDVVISTNSENKTTTGESSSSSSSATGDWVTDDKSVTDNDFVSGKNEDVQYTEQSSSSNTDSSDKNVALGDPLDGKDITLTLTPGSTSSTTENIDVEKLTAENSALLEKYNEILANEKATNVTKNGTAGKQLTEEVRDENDMLIKTTVTTVYPTYKDGKIVGYEVTTEVTTYTEKGSSSESNTTPGAETTVRTDMTEDMLDDEVKDLLSQPNHTKTEVKDDLSEVKTELIEVMLDADGNEVTAEQLAAMTDEQKAEVKKAYKVIKTTTKPNADDTQTFDPDDASEQPYGEDENKQEYLLPEKPVAAEPVTDPETGYVTTVVVNEIMSEDNTRVIGYETITEVKDGDLVISRDVVRIYETVIDSTITSTSKATKKVVTVTDSETITTETTYYTALESIRDMTVITDRDVEIEKVIESTTTSEVITIDGNEYFFYSAQMGEVKFSSTENAEAGANNLAAIPLDPDLWEINEKKNLIKPKAYTGVTDDNDLRDVSKTNNGTNVSWNIPYDFDELQALQKKLGDGQYILVGYGQYSEYLIYDSSNGDHAPRQFALLGKDGISYVYCVELGASIAYSNGSDSSATNPGTSINSNYTYKQYDIDKMLGTEINLKNGADSLAPLNSIVANGYMGTPNGVGSLEYIKDLLIRNGYTEVAETITEGQALAATQAAIWKYGNNGSKGFNSLGDVIAQVQPDFQPNGNSFIKSDSSTANGRLDEDYDNIEALYTLLCALAEDEAGADAPAKAKDTDFTGASITLKEKIEVEDYTAENVSEIVKEAVKDTSNKVYNTDLSFDIAISNSTYNGDLMVQVYVDGKLLTTHRIAGTVENSDGDLTGTKNANGSTTYTIEDLKLAENIDINLVITGAQNLADGVYVYECSKSQDFIGGQNELNQKFTYEVGLSFTTTAPTASMTTTQTNSESASTGTREDVKTDSYTQHKNTVNTSTTVGSVTNYTETTEVLATITVTTDSGISTKTEREWYFYEDPADPVKPTPTPTPTPEVPQVTPTPEVPEYTPAESEEPALYGRSRPSTINLEDEEVPLTEVPEDVEEDYEEDEEIEIIDEEIPLAEVPETGDESTLWLILAVVCAACLVLLNVTDKKRRVA